MTYPTIEELRCYLVDDNAWTEEEFADFLEQHTEHVQGEGTLLTRDEWEEKAYFFTDGTVDLTEPDTMSDELWERRKEGQL